MSETGYSVLDRPEILSRLFHPRPEPGYRQTKSNREDMMIPVENTIQVGASFHFAETGAPVILFFHGNGEIVSDYDDPAGLFNESGLNFFVADYRGYGESMGTPTVASMMTDSLKIFDYVRSYLAKNKLTGSLNVMGRSLGSASAIELGAKRSFDFTSLIIESGFARVSPLLQTLGVDPARIGVKESQGFENIDKIKMVSNPCLIIHAQFDHIIPFSDGQALFDACPSANKRLLEVKGANHNDIFLKGMGPYLEQVKKICSE